jgi:hypothetical protein
MIQVPDWMTEEETEPPSGNIEKNLEDNEKKGEEQKIIIHYSYKPRKEDKEEGD